MLRPTLFALIALLAFAPAARAGGDDTDNTVVRKEDGPSYFGFVRDNRGRGVADAEVRLRAASGEDVAVRTNLIGMYRTHVSETADPVAVQITCTKDGFRQAQVNRRTVPGPGIRVIETDCTLQRL